MKRFILPFLFIAAFLPASYSQPALEWVQRYNGTGSGIDIAFSLAIDNQGNIYASGNCMGVLNNDLLIAKYNSSGTEQWVKAYNGTGNGGDGTNGTNAIVVDNSGNVYVTGWSEGTGSTDIVTLKYNTDGVLQWEQRYDGAANGSDAPYGIALDASGNVYVTGTSTENSAAGNDFTTIKYNNNGVQQWIQNYNGAGNSYDASQFITLDVSGNVYVTGVITGALSPECAVIKYNTDGVQQWMQTYNGSAGGYDYGNCVAVDGSGNVYVTGSATGSSTNRDYLTIKYNSAGQQQWAETYSSGGAVVDEARSIVLDNSGNVYITGALEYTEGEGTTDNMGTIKYNSSGVMQWVQVFNGPGGIRDEAYSIAVDAAGNAYIIGYSDIPATISDMTTVKYNTNGVQQWVASYDGPASGPDTGFEIILGPGNKVYVSGCSWGTGTLMDFTTIKYDDIVPVDLISFTAEQNDNTINLNWSTAAETNNMGFEIERKTDGEDFTKIGFVKGSGTVSEVSSYIFIDDNPAAGSNVYRLKQVDFSGAYTYTEKIEILFGIPVKYSLEQNFPNPFNPNTHIRFSIPDDSKVVIKLFNILGKEIETLVNEVKLAGTYEINFNAKDLPSGIYFYQLQTGSFIETKKMTLLE